MFFSKNLLAALLLVAAVGVNGLPVELEKRDTDQELADLLRGIASQLKAHWLW